LAKTEHELFDGQPVIQFHEESDRRNFLRTAAKVGVGSALVMTGVACDNGDDGAAVGTGASPAVTPTDDTDSSPTTNEDNEAQVPQSDLEILNYALTLEHLESEFYKQGLDGNLLSGRERQLIQAIGAHEAAHVDVLTQTINDLGGSPAAKPKLKIPSGTFKDKAEFLATALTFEELGVAAYHGQVPNIETPDLLKAAASIAGVESRHAAILQKMTGGKPFPAPFEKSKSMNAVLKAAAPFIAS